MSFAACRATQPHVSRNQSAPPAIQQGCMICSGQQTRKLGNTCFDDAKHGAHLTRKCLKQRHAKQLLCCASTISTMTALWSSQQGCALLHRQEQASSCSLATSCAPSALPSSFHNAAALITTTTTQQRCPPWRSRPPGGWWGCRWGQCWWGAGAATWRCAGCGRCPHCAPSRWRCHGGPGWC